MISSTRINNPFRNAVLIFLLFTVLAIVVTWPLIPNFHTKIIGPYHGDNLEYVWKLWWTSRAVLDQDISPLLNDEIFYPYGYKLTYGEITPIHTYLGAPLTALFGPITTYNIFVLFSIILSGVFTCWYVYDLSNSLSAGLVAGLIFSVCPYQIVQIAGHLPLVDTQWLPLILLCLERFIRTRRFGYSVLTGLFIAAFGLSSWYYLFAVGIMLPIYFFSRIDKPISKEKLKAYLKGFIGMIAARSILILPFIIPYLRGLSGGLYIPIDEVIFWSANVTDYLTPNSLHFLWGNWVQHNLTPFRGEMPYEFILGWGLTSSILAIYGWKRSEGSLRRGWLMWVLAAIVLSLGPVIKIFGLVVSTPLPLDLVGRFNSIMGWVAENSLLRDGFSIAQVDRVTLPLPALFLRWFLPGIAGLRSWGRFSIFATFGIAVLAGLGFQIFLREIAQYNQPKKLDRLKTVSLIIVLALIFFEFYTGPRPLITPGPREVDKWLASLPEKHTIIQLPMAEALSGPQMYYTMHHGQRMASGYGTYLPYIFRSRYGVLNEFPSDDSIELLKNWGVDVSPDSYGVDFVLIDERSVQDGDPFWKEIDNQDSLYLITTEDNIRVYGIK